MAKKHTGKITSQPTLLASPWSLIRPSIEAFRRNAMPLILLMLVPFALFYLLSVYFINQVPPEALVTLKAENRETVMAGLQTILNSFETTDWLVLAGGVLVSGLISFFCGLASEYVFLSSARKKHVELMQALRVTLRIVLPFAGLSLLIGAALLLGLVALVIPGLILLMLWLPRLVIAPYVMFDEKLGPIKTFRRAGEIARVGGIWNVIAVGILLFFGISIVSGVLSTILGDSEVADMIVSLLEAVGYLAISAMPAIRYLEIKKLFVALPAKST